MLAHGIKPLHLRPDWKAPLLVVLATVLSFAGYELVRRVALLRILFGLSPGSTGPARLAGLVCLPPDQAKAEDSPGSVRGRPLK